MPLACFDTIRKVSTHLNHAEGMSLRYGVIVRVIFDGEIAFFSAELRNFFWRLRLFFLFKLGVGVGGNLGEIVNFVG